MKVSGRVLEINCCFILVVVLLLGLQLFLQHAEYRERLSERADPQPPHDPTNAPLQPPGLADPPPVSAADGTGNTVVEDANVVADPFVPNIRKSFTKRKAPYVRKAKKNKKKNKNRKNKHQKSDLPALKHTGSRNKRGKHADRRLNAN